DGDAPPADSGTDMAFEQTLTPGAEHYRTRRIGSSSDPETRALMIPNRREVRPAPAPVVGGCRRMGKKLPKPALPPLSVPLPQPTPYQLPTPERPDLSDIRHLGATSFLQFCRDPTIKAMRISWDKLDDITREEPAKAATYTTHSSHASPTSFPHDALGTTKLS